MKENKPTVTIPFKKLSDKAVTPTYAKPGDGAMDLTCTSRKVDMFTKQVSYGTDLAFEIPGGYVGLLFERSSVYKRGISLCNSVGVLDSGYRGEVTFKFNIINPNVEWYNVGDRIGQLLVIPYPKIILVETKVLSSSERGTGGYGSTNI